MFITLLFCSIVVSLDCFVLLRPKEKDPGALILSCVLILPGPILAAILNFEILHLPSVAYILTGFLQTLFPSFFQFMKP